MIRPLKSVTHGQVTHVHCNAGHMITFPATEHHNLLTGTYTLGDINPRQYELTDVMNPCPNLPAKSKAYSIKFFKTYFAIQVTL